MAARHGIPDARTFLARAADDPEWYWAAGMEDIGIHWMRPHDAVLDLSQGVEHPRFFVGGRINWADFAVDRGGRRRPGGIAMHRSRPRRVNRVRRPGTGASVSVQWRDPGHSAVEEGAVVVHPPRADALLVGEPLAAELSSWLDAIAEITRAANRAAPLDELLDLIAGTTARLTGYDFCAVFVADHERMALIIQGSYGLSQQYIDAINARTPILIRAGDTGEGPSSRAFRAQRPTTVLDIAADAPSRSWETVAAQQGYSSLLAVPLVVGQEPFGLVNCYTVARHDFSAREIILMESMANQAGLAI